MRRIGALVAGGLAAAALSACTQAQFQDVETAFEFPQADERLQVVVRNPDSVTVYRNIDQHPNLAVLCIDGVAFVTHTREAAPLHVPELNDTCGAAPQ